MNIALFGGSFDPIHNGHVQLSQVFRDKLSLDKTIIMPAAVSPFKQDKKAASGEHRYNMCRLAFEDRSDTEVSDLELMRQGTSYTYMTLQQLAQQYPTDRLYLVTGADMFLSVDRWKNPDIIFKTAVICGIPRNSDNIPSLEAQAEKLKALGAETVILDAHVMTVSSTEVRRRIACGEDISDLVPEKVAGYIYENGLYTQP